MVTTGTSTGADSAPLADTAVKRAQKKKLKRGWKKKLVMKLRADRDLSKTYFEARSKRSTEKKSAFRKKKNRKKA